MFAGRIIIDGMGYDIGDIDVAEIDPMGKPTGRMIKAKCILIQDSHNPLLQVEIRLTPEQLQEMGDRCHGKVVQTATPADLAALDGAGRILRG